MNTDAVDAAPSASQVLDAGVADMARLRDLGDTAAEQENAEAAIGYYEQALALARGMGNREWEGETLLREADVHGSAGHFELADSCVDLALTIARERGDRKAEAIALFFQGKQAAYVRRPATSKGYFERALAMVRETADRVLELKILRAMGAVAREHGWTSRAQRYYTQALPVAEECGDRQAEINILTNLGDLAHIEGHPDEAARHFEQALTVARETTDRASEGLLLNWLADVHEHVEDRVRLREQALAASQEARDQQMVGIVLNSLGNDYIAMGRYDDARRCLEQALPIAREIGNPVFVAAGVLKGMGLLALAEGNRKEAAQHFREALAILEAAGDVEYVAMMRDELANAERFRWPWQRRSPNITLAVQYPAMERNPIAALPQHPTQQQSQQADKWYESPYWRGVRNYSRFIGRIGLVFAIICLMIICGALIYAFFTPGP